uniref:SPOR domain-containing protein n=1 Tax=Magnetococcus massalia (strain MO-1) TaxID=451514 RepID=A0A1S7LMT0_MAGMO|nr:Conserved protein of unknown function. putative Sporulation domain protein [Candidatus Magnetococcus massalia]
MNPRYPTSRQYRRHRKAPSTTPFWVISGLLVSGIAGWLLIAGDGTQPSGQSRVEQVSLPADSPLPTPAQEAVEQAAQQALEIAAQQAEPREGEQVAQQGQPQSQAGAEAASVAEQPVEAEVSIKPGWKAEPVTPKKVTDARRKEPQAAESQVAAAKKESAKSSEPDNSYKPIEVDFKFYSGLTQQRVVLPGDQGRKGMRTALSRRTRKGDTGSNLQAIQSAVIKATSGERVAQAQMDKSKFAPRQTAHNPQAVAWAPAKPQQRVSNKKGAVWTAGQAIQSYMKVQDRAAERTVRRTPATQHSAVMGKRAFDVQVAAFSQYRPASALLGRLKRQGEQARILTGQVNGTAVYRVRLGPFSNRAAASRAAQRWQVKGLSAMVTRPISG